MINDQTLIFSMILDVMRDTNRIGLYMMWEAIESLVYMYGDKPAPNVTCCSCQNGELIDHTCTQGDRSVCLSCQNGIKYHHTCTEEEI